jgi:hypothetical protein
MFVVVGTMMALVGMAGRAQDAVVPWLVVKDANGQSLPVIGFGGSASTMYVRVVDPVNDIPVPLAIVRKDGGTANDLKGLYTETYFAQTDCAGTAYHKTFGEASDEVGHPGVTGWAHTVAPCNGSPGNQCLWASSIAVTADATPDPLDSRWTNGACTNDDYSPTSSLRQATSVLDITIAHPPPYSIP